MIKYGANEYRLIEEPAHTSEAGRVSVFYGTITVAKDGPIHHRELTLWEEIIHTIDITNGLQLSHQTVKTLAHGVQAILHQNTDLSQDWFMELYDDKNNNERRPTKMKLTDVIKIWDELHVKNTGGLIYAHLEEAVEKIVGIENGIPSCQPLRSG